MRYEDIDGESWKLLEPLEYASDIAGTIVVPKGFLTDLASIPRFFHRAFPKSGLHNWAAVVHDYLYAEQGLIKRDENKFLVLTREDCDRVFYEAMLVRGVSMWKAKSMFLAVKWFGGVAWKDHKKENETRFLKKLNASLTAQPIVVEQTAGDE